MQCLFIDLQSCLHGDGGWGGGGGTYYLLVEGGPIVSISIHLVSVS